MTSEGTPGAAAGQVAKAPARVPAQAGRPGALLGAALLVGLYAMAPGFYLAGLHVKKMAEVVDHVIPGLVILALVLVGIVWGARSATTMLLAGLGVSLAGFWMTVTHIGLALQAFRNQAPAGAAAYHCSTAFLALVTGLTWVWQYREAGSAPPPGQAGARVDHPPG